MSVFKKFKQRITQENIQKDKLVSEELLKATSLIEEEALYEMFKTSKNGLSQKDAEVKLDKDGPNKIVLDSDDSPLSRLIAAFANPFNIVLFVVAIITIITDQLTPEPIDYLTVIIIFALILISSLLAFFQAEKSSNAAQNLSKMISNTTRIYRDDKAIEIPVEDVVVGDIVRLSAGDIMPGDVRFLKTKDAFISQAALTGESAPVEKFYDVLNTADDISVTDISNIGFMGTNMVSGTALAIVVATGNETYIGAMAESITGKRSKNSFERGVESVSSLLLRFMIIMVPVVFILNGVLKQDWMSSFLFAITIAVGLTPEMLPMIMTATLGKGAVEMSKEQSIVKSLSAIQTFGEMDILCTDKTGTLTEDKIILEKYMDVNGNDDARVLRHSYLNSYFQTGLKNLMDVAVIARAKKEKIADIVDNYEIIDEIPFDFVRRRMSVVLVDGTKKRQLITKGAVEEMIDICSYILRDGKVFEMDENEKRKALDIYEEHNKSGLRVIAVAQKNDVADVKEFNSSDEKDMVLLGFVGFLDPPKESAAEAIDALKKHGVRTVVLTGDSEGVAIKVCQKVGIATSYFLTGVNIDAMTDEELRDAIRTCDLFAKVSPIQKERIVAQFQHSGHTVGYLGDGINDAPPLRQADVGISVDTAVEIAKETADIILLEKDLMILEKGVHIGRKTFGNIIKYIKMATSGNFGNMISVLIATIFIPFLPLLPIQIMIQNLLSDFSQIGMPFDNVDEEYLERPKRWDTHSIKRFMLIMGPVSSIFDILTFVVLWFIMGYNTVELSPFFQAGWFIFGSLSQILIVHMIRTRKIPFIQSVASKPLMFSTLSIALVAIIIAFTKFSEYLLMSALPLSYVPWLIFLILGYAIVTQLMKKVFITIFNEWL